MVPCKFWPLLTQKNNAAPGEGGGEGHILIICNVLQEEFDPSSPHQVPSSAFRTTYLLLEYICAVLEFSTSSGLPFSPGYLLLDTLLWVSDSTQLLACDKAICSPHWAALGLLYAGIVSCLSRLAVVWWYRLY